MQEYKANAVAEALGGYPYQSGGGCWLVVIQKRDTIVVISEDVVVEYSDPNHEGADCIGETEELKVIELYNEGVL